MKNQIEPQEKENQKPYFPPEIIDEGDLETRAGSPLGLPDPLDLTEP